MKQERHVEIMNKYGLISALAKACSEYVEEYEKVMQEISFGCSYIDVQKVYNKRRRKVSRLISKLIRTDIQELDEKDEMLVNEMIGWEGADKCLNIYEVDVTEDDAPAIFPEDDTEIDWDDEDDISAVEEFDREE